MNLTRLPALALGALLTFTSLTSLAQQTPTTPNSVRTETRAYISRNVLPTLRVQRQKLETQLTTSDKAQLAVYRAQLHDLRQRRNELGRTAAPAIPNTHPAPETQQAQQLRTETHTLLQSVEQLARKYDADIARLTQELKPQREQWANDLQAITTQHANPAAQQHPRKSRRPDGVRRLLQPARFLLLQPDAPAPTATDRPAQPGGGVYPNPATAASQLAYEVTKAGPVLVELLDGRGNTLRTVAQEAKQEKGPHTLAVDVADLPTGTYFFKITTRAGAETRRFVKE